MIKELAYIRFVEGDFILFDPNGEFVVAVCYDEWGDISDIFNCVTTYSYHIGYNVHGPETDDRTPLASGFSYCFFEM